MTLLSATQTLRDLERDGLADRQVFPPKPPSVECSPTPRSMLVPLDGFVEWAESRHDEIKSAWSAFDAQSP